MHLKLNSIAVAISLALAAGSGRALTEDVVYPPPGGWGYQPGTSQGQGMADITLPGVAVVGRSPDKLSAVYVINVPYTGSIPVPHVDRSSGGTIDPAQQQVCITACDQTQKIATDLCNVAAAKAAASGTVSSIGIAFAVGGVVTWKGGILLGATTGFGSYLIANQLAKDHAATLNLACIAQAAQNHVNCINGTCGFTG